MKCPRCGSEKINKNGHRRGKPYLICKDCHRQFLEHYYRRGSIRICQEKLFKDVR